jgi:hypothetical protein
MSKDNVRERFESLTHTGLSKKLHNFLFTKNLSGEYFYKDVEEEFQIFSKVYQAAHAESAARIAELEKDAARLKQFTAWADSGLCPALVFNDNGYWAVSFDGVIPMDFSEPPNDAQLLIDVEKIMWRETVAEAIDQAITNTGDKT